MAGDKKARASIDALRADVQNLTESFWSFRDVMLADAAVAHGERGKRGSAGDTDVTAFAGAPSASDIDEAASMLQALAHPQRLRMALLLAQSPTSVSHMVETLGLQTTGAAYHHLNVLLNLGLAEGQKRGEYVLTAQSSPVVHTILTGLFGEVETAPEKRKKKKDTD